MAVEVHLRRLKKSWQFDFKLPGHPRERRAGFRTKAQALTAGNQRLDELVTGARQVIFADAYEQYMAATAMKDRSRDRWEDLWDGIKPELGHLLLEDVTTSAMDSFKSKLPPAISPNHHLGLIKAVLRFMWKREKLKHVPYVPMAPRPRKEPEWYTQDERDLLLDGMFRWYPQWYLFCYVTCRLGLLSRPA